MARTIKNANTKDPARPNRIGDEAVKNRTGKDWKQWFAILDKAGGRKMAHRDLAAYLHDELGVGPWWCQMVAVEYEKKRGLRAQHERPDGWEISRSKTLAVSVSKAYQAWSDMRLRSRWLADPGFTVRKATRPKCLRITWVDGESNVEVLFTEKGPSKSQVVVQHGKLPTPKLAERMKSYWGESLDRLQETLEA